MEEKNGLQRNNSEENELNLSDIFRLVKTNWLWFVVSITICISLSVYYIKCTPKQYACSAAVLIKDSNDGASGMVSEAAAFQDLDLFNTTNSVDNEMLVFKSKTLMQKVVQRLHLDLSYRMQVGLRHVEQYRQTPLQLHFLDANANERFALTAKPLNDKQVNLSAFDYDTEEDHSAVNLNAMYYDTIQTPVGRLVVTPTLYLTE